jgi:hypothetical protein
MIGWLMNDDLEWSGRGLIELLEGPRKTTKNINQYIQRSSRDEIRSEHLPNTDLEPYRYSNLLDKSKVVPMLN